MARIADINGEAQQATELRRRLAEATAERDLRMRELAELRALNRDLEYRVITANRSLAYGLGKALIEARSLGGLIALPRRLGRLAIKQKAKRRARVPETATRGVAAHLRYVDEALERLGRDGADAAAGWIGTLPKRYNSAKSRAMTELAMAVAHDRLDIADTLGNEAAALDPGEPRLLALALLLRERGLVIAPAAIGEAIESAQSLSEAQAALIAGWREDARILRNGHPDRDVRDLPIAEDRGPELVIVHAAGDRHDHRAARIAAIAAADGRPRREAELGAFTLDRASPPPALTHLLAGAPEPTRRAIVAARHARAPVLLDVGAIDPDALSTTDSEARQVARARLTWLAESANAVIARGAAVAKALHELTGVAALIAGDRFEIAPGGEADDEAMAIEFGIARDGPVLGCITSLDDDPGSGETLRSFARFTRDGRAARLVFLGRGAGMAELAEQAALLDVGERVQFIGLPLAVRWPALFRLFDLAVFPRRRPEAPGSGLETAFGVALASRPRVRAISAPPGERLWAEAIVTAMTAAPQTSDPPDDDVIADLHRTLAALPVTCS